MNDTEIFFNKIRANSVELKKLTEKNNAQKEVIVLLENEVKKLQERTIGRK